MVSPLNKRVQLPRGTTTENDAYVGPSAQLTVDSLRNELRIHDGVTKGGFRIPNLTQLRKLFLSSDSELGGLSFPAEGVGILSRVSDKSYKLRSLTVGDDLIIANTAGDAGDPKISLPNRLKAAQPYSTWPDTLTSSGFYVVPAGTAGLPSDLLSVSDVGILVIGYVGSVNRVMQLGFSLNNTTTQQYFRVQTGGVWSSWQTVNGSLGSLVSLAFGSDQLGKLWSAADIMSLVRSEVSRLQYIDSGNTAKAFSMNELFRVDGNGDGTVSGIVGPFNVATNDRFEIVAAATTRKQAGGDTATARIEIEVGSTWTVIATASQTVGAFADQQNVQCVARVIANVSGYQTAAVDWSVLSTVAGGAPTGRFRITYGAAGYAASRGTRWR